ncbi:2Fe-2S iron-sulfur cluster-binding protein [Fulvivirga sedimenti]|jgi:2Fe-2S ferredoxin|uniref:(2Fe-2S)-binding protein n=1 Tax=Fulvivirga sedimenti TaxID=2879465 RepID=A0A9X1HP59_9BACT|nr:2Fe-2S iron-sulfur cluster-binding protein [Fulvivirga sedimenti]MCA6074217.1 (2Fe-2S)-binding protein [Fulvivirga sedimenti]
MPEITISNLAGKKVKVPGNQSILLAFQENFIDWMHACGGKGRCTTCAFNVQAGMDALSPLTPVEKRFLEDGKLSGRQRLACQTRCLGDVTIEVPPANQLPHLVYRYE